MTFQGKKQIDQILAALGDHLKSRKTAPIDMLVCGGAALNMLELVGRTTVDIDILAFVLESESGPPALILAKPFPPFLAEAVDQVGRVFRLGNDWLNSGPTHLIQEIKLPEGLVERAKAMSYGPRLKVRLLSRYDQIHLKLFAVADKGPEKHDDDLRQLKPTPSEIKKAAQWLLTSVNKGYREMVKGYLKEIGYDDVAREL